MKLVEFFKFLAEDEELSKELLKMANSPFIIRDVVELAMRLKVKLDDLTSYLDKPNALLDLKNEALKSYCHKWHRKGGDFQWCGYIVMSGGRPIAQFMCLRCGCTYEVELKLSLEEAVYVSNHPDLFMEVVEMCESGCSEEDVRLRIIAHGLKEGKK